MTQFIIRRLSPFGLVQTYANSAQIKERIKKLYGDTTGVDPSSDSNEGQKVMSSPHEQAHGSDEQDIAHQEKSLLSTVPIEATQLGGVTAGMSSDGEDPSQIDVQSEHLTTISELEQQLQQQQKKFTSLCEFVYEDLLPRLQKQEQRYGDNELLMKDMFLDLDMVHEALEITTSKVTNWVPKEIRGDPVAV